MQTKEKILAAALKLYNNKGINTITTRHIAANIAISPGNLHYHFKQTDDIIKTLYDRLATEFDDLMQALEALPLVDLAVLRSFSRSSIEVAYKYRFIFLHFVEVATRIPSIRTHYKSLRARRETEFKAMFKKLIQNGTFRNDLPGEVWDELVTQIFIVGDFWQSNNELSGRFTGDKLMIQYEQTISAMFFPYLK